MVKIVFIGNGFHNRLNTLKSIENCTVDVINGVDEKSIMDNLLYDTIDLFVIDNTKTLFKKIVLLINSNISINNIPIISLITKNDLLNNIIPNSDLFVSEFVTDIEFKYYVKTIIKMKLMDDELKKDKIVLELKVKERTLELEKKIIEEHKLKTEIQKSEIKYKRIYDNVPDLIYTLDLKGNILTINDNIKNIGYEPNELIGKNISCLLDDKYLQLSHNNIQKKISDNNLMTKYNVVVNAKNNKKIVLEVNSHFIKNDENKLEIFVIGRDMTEQLKYEEDLKISKLKAEQSNKIKNVFISNMSHEIRTPMNSIIGFTSLLEYEKNPDKIKSYIDTITRSGNLLLSLIDDIMDLSKMESGNMKIKNTQFKINNLLDDIKKQFELELKIRNKNNIELINETNETIEIYTDYKRINQILNNLILNSIKFTSTGYIKYGLKIKNNFIEFYVEDTGIGIKQENLNLVFKRFHQIDREKFKKQEGSGLGLTICKAIVELLGGKLWIESKYKIGTTVYFTIPIEKNIPMENKNIPNKSNLCNNKNALIIDYDDINYDLFKIILLSSGIIVNRVKNHLDFYDKINNSNIKYDMILLNIDLYQNDGLELINWLNDNNINIPIIIQSDIITKELKKELLVLGVKYFITKPTNTNDLLNKIKLICN